MLLSRLDDPVPAAFDALVERRMTHEPVAYITGRRAFWTIDLLVGPGVLVPRADSETLIEAAVDHFAGRAPARILDLGTGPGTLLLAALAEWPDATGLGIDASAQALGYARRNGRALGMADRVGWARGDWTAGIDGPFDLILANPLYRYRRNAAAGGRRTRTGRRVVRRCRRARRLSPDRPRPAAPARARRYRRDRDRP